MRRISLGVTFLLLVPSIALSNYVVPLRCHVQYSPYAFGRHSNGLVPGGINYSPYAFKPNTSGLVFEGARYIPYAFTYKSTGLVLDYDYYPVPYVVGSLPCPPQQARSGYAGAPPCGTRTVNRPSPSYDQDRGTVDESAVSTERQDAMTIIRQYLRERKLSDVTISRILRIDNKLVSADFIVGGRNLLIKYWDPTQLQSSDATAAAQPGSTGSCASRTIEKYRKDWEAFAAKYQQEGGEIYVVAGSGRTDIVAALDACEKMPPANGEPDAKPAYAKQ